MHSSVDTYIYIDCQIGKIANRLAYKHMLKHDGWVDRQRKTEIRMAKRKRATHGEERKGVAERCMAREKKGSRVM